MATDGPVFSVQPVFVGWITLLVQLPFQLFFTLWASLFFGGLSQTLVPGSRMPFILFGALAFFGVAVVACFGKLLNYARTEYRLFRRSARIRSALGFGNVSGSGISVRDIRSPDEAFDKVKQLVDSCRE